MRLVLEHQHQSVDGIRILGAVDWQIETGYKMSCVAGYYCCTPRLVLGKQGEERALCAPILSARSAFLVLLVNTMYGTSTACPGQDVILAACEGPRETSHTVN